MIYQGAIKCKPYLKKRVLKPNILGTLADVKKFLSTALLTHTIFDLGSRSLSELDGVTAGSYICLMQSRLRAHLDTPITGTATAGGVSSITLAAGASAVDDYYNGMVIEITAGTRSGQFRVITAYNGTTRVATVGTAWTGGATDNTSQYKIGGGDKFETADITPHISIYLTGIKINTYNQIESKNNTIKIKDNNYTIDSSNKMIIIYLDLSIDGNTNAIYIDETDIYYSTINIVFLIIYGSNIYNCIINNISTINANSKNININNSIIQTTTDIRDVEISSYGSKIVTINNVIIKNIDTYLIFSKGDAGTGIINTNNTYFTDINFYAQPAALPKTSQNNAIYINNVNIITNNISNYVLQPAVKTEYDILGNAVNNFTLDWTEIDFADFENVEGEIGREKTLNTKAYAPADKDYYRITFKDSTLIPDGFKAILTKGFWLFVQRDGIEEILIPTGAPKKIKNMQFYENDGTTVYDFLADDTANDVKDEYFLIKAKDASDNVVVLAWYGNNLYRTIFSDCYDDTTYTIERVFQIWQVDDFQNNSARFKASNSYRQLANSPIVGSLRFNDFTDESVVS